jgi:siroheme synthase
MDRLATLPLFFPLDGRCAVFNATRPDESRVAGTVGTITPLLAGLAVKGPCVLIVGRVLHSRSGAFRAIESADCACAAN